MDINSISDFVLNILLTFLPTVAGKVAEGFLNDIGSDLLQLIKDKFQKDRDSKIALSYFLRSPHDTKSQEIFLHHLRKFLETDENFRGNIQNLIVNSNFSGSNLTAYGDRNTVGQVAGTIIDIRPDQNATINFVLNINGIGDVISKLPTFIPPERMPSVQTIEYVKFVNDVRKTISKHKLDIEADIDIISDLLSPAVAIEREEKYPNPKRLLKNVVFSVGKTLEQARIFKNFGTPMRDYGNEQKITILSFPELSQELSLEEDSTYFARERLHVIQRVEKPRWVRTQRKSDKDEEFIMYTIYYNYYRDEAPSIGGLFKNIFIDDHHSESEYYVRFAERKMLLDIELISKFLRALFTFHVRQMRYPKSLETLKNLGSKKT